MIEKKFREVFNEHYALGSIKSIKISEVGDNSKSCVIVYEKDGKQADCYLKQHHPTMTPDKLLLQHRFMKFFKSKAGESGLDCAVPIETVSGEEWIRSEYDGIDYYYACYTCLHGEEPYSWWHNEISDNGYRSTSRSMGIFHAVSYDFETENEVTPIKDLLDEWINEMNTWLPEMKGNTHLKLFYDYLMRQWGNIIDTAEWCTKEAEKFEDQLKVCLIHQDYNPQNCKYDESDNVTAVFDFDWIAKGYRIYDIAWLGHQMLSSWRPENFADMSMKRFYGFLKIYDETMIEYGCPIGPLTQTEREAIPVMLAAISIKIIRDFVEFLHLDPEDNTFEWLLGAWKHFRLIEICRDEYSYFKF